MYNREVRVYILLICLLCWVISLRGQPGYGGVPLSFGYTSVRSVSLTRIPVTFNVEDLRRVDAWRVSNVGSPLAVAELIPVSLDLVRDGERLVLGGGERIIRLRLGAAGALALMLYYSSFSIPEGGRLYIYGSGDRVLGAYTSKTNPVGSKFATEFIVGDELTLEYEYGVGFVDPAIVIEAVGYGYDHIVLGELGLSMRATSGACEVDMNCIEGSMWQREKGGVCRMLQRIGRKSYVCTGSLLNNTSGDLRPYILSAYHCSTDGDTGPEASVDDMLQWQFFFGDETLGCGVGSGVSFVRSMTGCSRVAYSSTVGESDGLLLLLSEDIPLDYGVYYNGWDCSGAYPVSGVGIHHPNGDHKKVSTYYDVARSYTFRTTGIVGDADAHWDVEFVSTLNGHGVTEGGSSGSPLFNERQLIVGTLTGGNSGCKSDEGSGLNIYGKLSYHWSAYSSKMVDYLDPVGSGVLSLSGRYADPSDVPSSPSSFTASRVPSSVASSSSSVAATSSSSVPATPSSLRSTSSPSSSSSSFSVAATDAAASSSSSSSSLRSTSSSSSFSVAVSDAVPSSLRSTSSVVTLSWSPVLGSVGYRLYDNGLLLADTVDLPSAVTTYAYDAAVSGHHEYRITSISSTGKESDPAITSMELPDYKSPEAVTALRTSSSGEIAVQWKAPIYVRELHWGSLRTEGTVWYYSDDYPPVYFGHRWLPEELSPYHRKTITSISCWLLSGYAYELCIFQGGRVYRQSLDTQGGSPAIKHDIPLTTPYVIDATLDMYLTLYARPERGLRSGGCAMLDKGPSIPGRGNLYSLDGTVWHEIDPDDGDTNFALSATVTSTDGTLPASYVAPLSTSASSPAVIPSPSPTSRSAVPAAFPEIKSYKIYRNGEYLSTENAPLTRHTDRSPALTNVYHVTAVFSDGYESPLSNPSEEISFVGNTSIEDLVSIHPVIFSNEVELLGASLVKDVEVFSVAGASLLHVSDPAVRLDVSELPVGIHIFHLSLRDGSVRVLRGIKR